MQLEYDAITALSEIIPRLLSGQVVHNPTLLHTYLPIFVQLEYHAISALCKIIPRFLLEQVVHSPVLLCKIFLRPSVKRACWCLSSRPSYLVPVYSPIFTTMAGKRCTKCLHPLSSSMWELMVLTVKPIIILTLSMLSQPKSKHKQLSSKSSLLSNLTISHRQSSWWGFH